MAFLASITVNTIGNKVPHNQEVRSLPGIRKLHFSFLAKTKKKKKREFNRFGSICTNIVDD